MEVDNRALEPRQLARDSSTLSAETQSQVAYPRANVSPVATQTDNREPTSTRNHLVEIGTIFHNGEEIVHQCTVDGCASKTIGRPIDFKRHYDNYHGGLLYACPDCSFSDGRRDKLIKHFREYVHGPEHTN